MINTQTTYLFIFQYHKWEPINQTSTMILNNETHPQNLRKQIKQSHDSFIIIEAITLLTQANDGCVFILTQSEPKNASK